jgi:phage FluMu protein Com
MTITKCPKCKKVTGKHLVGIELRCTECGTVLNEGNIQSIPKNKTSVPLVTKRFRDRQRGVRKGDTT